MNYGFKLIILSGLFYFISCIGVNSKLGKIQFINKVEDVEDSITKMTTLMGKVTHDTINNTNYYFREDYLYINSVRIGTIDQYKKFDSLPALANFTNDNKMQFLKLADYLRLNHITGSYFEVNANMWFFEYYESWDLNDEAVRNIVVLEDAADLPSIYNAPIRIINRQDKILLLSQ